MGPKLNQKYGNLVYSIHPYAMFKNDNQVARLTAYFDDAHSLGLCVIIGEYGVDKDPNAYITSDARAIFNISLPGNIGRIYWDWAADGMPLTATGGGWQINQTNGTKPSNLSWVGDLIWKDNRDELEMPIK